MCNSQQSSLLCRPLCFQLLYQKAIFLPKSRAVLSPSWSFSTSPLPRPNVSCDNFSIFIVFHQSACLISIFQETSSGCRFTSEVNTTLELMRAQYRYSKVTRGLDIDMLFLSLFPEVASMSASPWLWGWRAHTWPFPSRARAPVWMLLLPFSYSPV